MNKARMILFAIAGIVAGAGVAYANDVPLDVQTAQAVNLVQSADADYAAHIVCANDVIAIRDVIHESPAAQGCGSHVTLHGVVTAHTPNATASAAAKPFGAAFDAIVYEFTPALPDAIPELALSRRSRAALIRYRNSLSASVGAVDI